MKTQIGRWYLLLPLLAGALACKEGSGAGTPDAGAVVLSPENVARAQIAPVETGPRLAGTLQPKNQAVIRAEVSGEVTDVRVDVGQTVKAGEVLGRMEAAPLRDAHASAVATLRSAQSALDVAKRELQRTERLVQGGALAERDLEVARSNATSAEARVSEAQARLASARNQLSDATFRAPFDGVVSQRGVSTGDIVAPGAMLFTIIDPSSMRVEASFPSDALQVLRLGTAVHFSVRGYPGQTFTGEIERIAPAADPATRQIPVLVAIPNPGGELVAGLFAEGRVSVERREALSLPLSAIEEVGDSVRVRRIRDGVVELVEVGVGIRDARTERVEITSGLSSGDLVLAGTARDLVQGTPVQLPKTSTSTKPQPEPEPGTGGASPQAPSTPPSMDGGT